MIRIFFLCCLLLLAVAAHTQVAVEQYSTQRDSLRIGAGKGDYLPFGAKGYTLLLPDTAKAPTGVVIALEHDKPARNEPANRAFEQEATGKGLAILYISTGIPVDLYFSPRSLHYIDSVINLVFARHRLGGRPVFFLGVNLGAHRALKYIVHNKSSNATTALNIKGVVLCEGVLDWVRQWYEGKKAIRDSVSESSVFEGRMVTYLLEHHLGGTPKTALPRYLQFSPYSYFDDRVRYISYFRQMALRAYTEPATHYWMEVKGKTSFDTNFPDQVGIVNELRLAGNKAAELHVFNQPQTNTDRRNPHYTWGLVDKGELVAWLLRQVP